MNIHESLYNQGWYRPRADRVLAGVCAGVGRKLGISAWGARLLVLVLMVALPGSPLLLYPIMWVLMPNEPAWQPAGQPSAPGQQPQSYA